MSNFVIRPERMLEYHRIKNRRRYPEAKIKICKEQGQVDFKKVALIQKN